MTRRRACDGVAMRLARLSAPVEHNRQRRDRKSQRACDSPARTEHIWILLHGVSDRSFRSKPRAVYGYP